jgi:hypothetical protein
MEVNKSDYMQVCSTHNNRQLSLSDIDMGTAGDRRIL